MTTSPAPVALAIGDEMPTSQFGPLTRSHIVRYAGSGGDFNPIHHDEVFAREAGYPTVFAMGLYTAGLAGAALAEAVGPLQLRKYGVRYVGQVWPGDTLTVTVRETASDGGVRSLALEVQARADDAEPRRVLTGTAEAAA